jgi:hypothetical protein
MGKLYTCICGFTTEHKNEFQYHLLKGGREEKGQHRSARLASNYPQASQATPEATQAEVQPQSKTQEKPKPKVETLALERTTTNPQEATQLRIVPRTFTITYTPIMMNAQLAAIREWGWPQDMSIENFLDTIIYHAFRDRGIILQGYVVADDHHFE